MVSVIATFAFASTFPGVATSTIHDSIDNWNKETGYFSAFEVKPSASNATFAITVTFNPDSEPILDYNKFGIELANVIDDAAYFSTVTFSAYALKNTDYSSPIGENIASSISTLIVVLAVVVGVVIVDQVGGFQALRDAFRK